MITEFKEKICTWKQVENCIISGQREWTAREDSHVCNLSDTYQHLNQTLICVSCQSPSLAALQCFPRTTEEDKDVFLGAAQPLKNHKPREE